MKAYIEIVKIEGNVITASNCPTDGCPSDMGGICSLFE